MIRFLEAGTRAGGRRRSTRQGSDGQCLASNTPLIATPLLPEQQRRWPSDPRRGRDRTPLLLSGKGERLSPWRDDAPACKEWAEDKAVLKLAEKLKEDATNLDFLMRVRGSGRDEDRS